MRGTAGLSRAPSLGAARWSAVLVAILAASACGGDGRVVSEPDFDLDPSALDCGSEVEDPAEVGGGDAVRRCFLDAVDAGRHVVMVSTRFTEEGDATHLLVEVAGSRLTVTRDELVGVDGEREVSTADCTSVEGYQEGEKLRLRFDGCSPTGYSYVL